MKKLYFILLLFISFCSYGQTADVITTKQIPATGANKNNQTNHFANTAFDQNFRLPRHSANGLYGAKDSSGYVYFNTTVNKVISYRGSAIWDTLATSAPQPLTFSAPLVLTGNNVSLVITTDNVPEGTTNLYWTQTRFNTAFAGKNSDNLTEGAVNKFYTDARAALKANAATTILATGNGITGGGSLAANRTIALDFTYLDGHYQSSLGFTPENVANKVTNLVSPSNTTYPTTQAVVNAIADATTGVSSFNGRTGAVVPVIGDYSSFFITPTSTNTLTNKSISGASNTINSISATFYDPTSSIQTQLDSKIGRTGISATSPILYNNTTGVISEQVANTSQNGYLSSTDWNTFNGKQSSGSYITALTGDVTASGPGSATSTLATVNSSPGSYGSANSYTIVNVNGKGLVTAASSGSIQIAQSQVTVLPDSLAKKLNISDTSLMLNNVVHKALVENITGQKTFSGNVLMPNLGYGTQVAKVAVDVDGKLIKDTVSYSSANGAINYLPVFTGTSSIGNSPNYYMTAFSGVSGKDLIFGNASITSSSARIAQSDNITLTDNGHHSFGAYSNIIFAGTGSSAITTYDSKNQATGSVDANHMIDFQARNNFATIGNLDHMYGFDASDVHQGTGTIAKTVGFHFTDPTVTGGGIIADNNGIYIENVLNGSINHAIKTNFGAVTFGDKTGILLDAASNLDVGTGTGKTNTTPTAVSYLGRTNDGGGHYGALELSFIGATSATDRVWDYQTIEQGVVNDGIERHQAFGGRMIIGNSTGDTSLLYVAGTVTGGKFIGPLIGTSTNSTAWNDQVFSSTLLSTPTYLMGFDNANSLWKPVLPFGFTNPMTTLGDAIYGGTSGVATRLAGNATTTQKFLTQTGTGSASAAPVWTDLSTLNISPANIYTTSAAPTVTLGAAAGTGATYTITGNNQDHIITVTAGTLPIVGNLFSLVMSGGYAYPNSCVPVIGRYDSGMASTTRIAPVSITTTGYTISVGITALTAAGVYTFLIHNGGY